MPFTLAHPAASIPFTRRGLVLSALVVGSVAPDLSYFMTLNTNQSFGHTIPGLFWFCLPMGLVVLWLFHSLLKRPMIALLPDGFQRRLASLVDPFAFSPLLRLWRIVVSLLIGSITHLVWDSFTHPDGWIVERFPVFETVVFRLAGSDFQIFKLLQYASSILGLAVLVWWIWKWYQKARPLPGSGLFPISTLGKWMIISFMLGIATGLAGWSTWLRTPEIDSLYSFKEFVAQIFVTGTSAFCVELIVFGLIWKGRVEKEAKHA
jgi:hypothetical protein